MNKFIKRFSNKHRQSHIVQWNKHLLFWDFSGVDTELFYNLVKVFENNINEISLCYPMHTQFDPLPTLENLKIFQNYCITKNIKCNFITGGGHKYQFNTKELENFYEWQSFFFTKTLVHDSMPPIGHNKDIGKLFTCLNNHSRLNRCIFLDYLAKHKLIESNYVSWHDTQQGNYCYPNNDYKFTWWKPKNLVLEESWTDIQSVWNTPDLKTDYFIPPVTCWQDSLFSVITESQVPETFITEKTALAINHIRPFIVYASPNFHQSLIDLGFKLFDNVFDYSFDTEPDENIRAEQIVKQLSYLEKQDYNLLKDKMHTTMLYNYKHIKTFSSWKSIPVPLQSIIRFGIDHNTTVSKTDTFMFFELVEMLKND
jgi:hypothetical protein